MLIGGGVMKSLSAESGGNHQNQFSKGDKFHRFRNQVLFLFLYLLLLAIIFSICALWSPGRSVNMEIRDYYLNGTASLVEFRTYNDRCNLFKGQWVPDPGAPSYNTSCLMIRDSNCFSNGRKDNDFLFWSWKPDECALPRFDSKAFLSIVRGKTVAFIGDSVARNQVHSLICLLSAVELAREVSREPTEDGKECITWKLSNHNLTLMLLWSPFLVAASHIRIRGEAWEVDTRVDLDFDKVNERWSRELPSVHYAIFSTGHWFFRRLYLHEGGKFIGCIDCKEPNVTQIHPNVAIQKAVRAAFKRVNECRNCSGIVGILRTYSPEHFENGKWNTGGYCIRTKLLSKEEPRFGDWENEVKLKKMQVEEVESARRVGEKEGKRFGVIDITELMQRRPDGHPGEYWGNRWNEPRRDCIHWCLPGPIDTWNHFLSVLLQKLQHQPV